MVTEFAYTTSTGCICKFGYSGNSCEASKTNLLLQSVTNSLLDNTLKLATFTSIKHTLEDVQLALTASSENIQDSIRNLAVKINEQFRSMGEFMSYNFAWIDIMVRYSEAIEFVHYFYSITNMMEGIKMPHGTNISLHNLTESSTVSNRFSLLANKDIDIILLNPTGIKKWLYQINYLRVGRRDSELNYHNPLIFMVMDKYKDRLCFQDYKDEVTRTYRQLMLLQYKGYVLWGRAYSSANRDSTIIANHYAKVLSDQMEYLQNNTCSVNIPHSKSLQNCCGGYYIHKSQVVDVVCNDGYFRVGRCFVRFIFKSKVNVQLY